ncbi:ABC transporter permease [Streptomyces sp. NPDC058665]|uniref:ABC transporter permease n=1 Tax=Streptomyces sp. NPDC058665 TaxID=3346586 RepID=UPI00364F3B69
MTAAHVCRVVTAGIRVHFVGASRSRIWLLFTMITPVVYALVALYLLDAARRPDTLPEAAVSAGLMGVWSSVLFGSGTAIQDMRFRGTLEPVMVAPTPFSFALIPVAVSSSAIGLYSMVATVLCGAAFFGTPLDYPAPAALLFALMVCLFATGMMGMLLATTFVLMRNANAVVNTLDHPVWMLSGTIMPLALLPGWLHPLSWILPSTWGAEAVHRALAAEPVAWPATLAVLTGLVYLGLSLLALRHVEHRARVTASLALA